MQQGMEVVVHGGVSKAFDGKYLQEFCEPISDPELSMVVGPVGIGVEAVEVCSADAARVAVKEPFYFRVVDIFAGAGHEALQGRPPLNSVQLELRSGLLILGV